jgi:hypothetical protein
MRAAAALLCVALAQALPPPRDAASTAAKTGTGAITGRVLAGTTDTGVAAAMVYLLLPGTTSEPRAVLTDRNGRFTIDKLPAGSYRLAVQPPENNARFIAPERGTGPIDVEEAATVTAPDQRLPFAAAISGRVVDERGEPLAGIEVYAMGERYGDPKLQRLGYGWQNRTDDQGRFRLFALPAGDAIVTAQTDRMFSGAGDVDRPAGFVTTYYPDVLSQDEAKRITLRQGSDIDGIEVRMVRMRTFRITGTIVDSRGLPFAGGRVGLRHTINGSGGTSMISMTGDGRFEARAVLPGSYTLVVGLSDGPYGPFEKTPVSEYASVPVTVSDANIEDLVVTTRPGADLTVRVIFESDRPRPAPARFGLIGWTPRDFGLNPAQSELGPDSTVLLKHVYGPVLVRPVAFGGGGQPEWFLKGVFFGERDITDVPTEFTPADAAKVRVVMTNKGATVTGRVNDEAGKPAPEFAVVLFPEDRAAWLEHGSATLSTGREKGGDYRFAGVRAGRYRIAAIERSRLNRSYVDPVGFLESVFPETIAITVTENEQRVVDLVLKKAAGY